MKRLVSISLAISMLLGLLSGSVAKAQEIVHLPLVLSPPSQRAALAALYESTDGDEWYTNTDWLSDTVHHCDWYGITCDSEAWLVLEIELTGNNLQGEVPPEFGDLVNLESLTLSGNFLTSLPPEIGNLTNLEYLNLGYTPWIGPPPSSLPPESDNIPNSMPPGIGNNLTSLPPEIGNLTNLQHLDLSQNDFSSLPPEIDELHNLQYLNLWRNDLTSLPPEIGKLHNLETLLLGHLYDWGQPGSGNRLTSLPPEIGNLTSLRELDLSYGTLISLPPEIGNLTSLHYLFIPANGLTSLPPEIVNLTNLHALNLNYNPIPCLPGSLLSWYENIPTHYPGSFAECP